MPKRKSEKTSQLDREIYYFVQNDDGSFSDPIAAKIISGEIDQLFNRFIGSCHLKIKKTNIYAVPHGYKIGSQYYWLYPFESEKKIEEKSSISKFPFFDRFSRIGKILK